MKSNRTAFCDLCSLIAVTETEDADGYTLKAETPAEVFCSITSGVARSEMYEALKAGIKLSGTAEVWEDDFSGQTVLEHEGVRYNIVRAYPTGRGTLELSLSQEVH